MSRTLVLGGTGEGLRLARRLGADDVYSVAGLGMMPEGLSCALRVGGFGGVEGLRRYLEETGMDRVIDATHPYAAQISAHARAATHALGLPLWAIRRPVWLPGIGDDWRMVEDWEAILAAIAGFRRPLFTLGREPLAHLETIPETQHWTIRCLEAQPARARASIIADRGPFALDAERALFAREGFDVIVSKNSGGDATHAKLIVARERGLPVVMLRRPRLPDADRTFESVESLLEALP
ncbi:MAG: cobalt-precorrin-6A reductase [Dyella sp.]